MIKDSRKNRNKSINFAKATYPESTPKPSHLTKEFHGQPSWDKNHSRKSTPIATVSSAD